MNNLNPAVDSLLDKIRLNSIMLASKHIKNHVYYLNCSIHSEIPVIILSVFSSSLFSRDSKKYASRNNISCYLCNINDGYYFNIDKIIYENY